MATEITEASTIVADPDVFSCDLGGGKALLDLRTSIYYSINSVGAFVWERLQQPTDMAALHKALTDEFDVEPERCMSDLTSLLKKFADAGLVQIKDERPS